MPAKLPKLMIFDWDGTLADSIGAITGSLAYACQASGLPVPPIEKMRYIIGMGLDDSLRYLLPDIDRGVYAQLGRHYRKEYMRVENEIALFPGVRASLDWLAAAGCVLAISTGKSERGIQAALKSQGLESVFAWVRSADETIAKPDPRMLTDVLDALGFAPGDAIFVGDTLHDHATGQNAGVRTYLVASGAHPRVELEKGQADAVYDDLNHFMRVVWGVTIE